MLAKFPQFYVPKEPYDMVPLVKTVAIVTEKGLVVLDPTKYICSNFTFDHLPSHRASIIQSIEKVYPGCS
jgi:hypothetical protein